MKCPKGHYCNTGATEAVQCVSGRFLIIVMKGCLESLAHENLSRCVAALVL